MDYIFQKQQPNLSSYYLSGEHPISDELNIFCKSNFLS